MNGLNVFCFISNLAVTVLCGVLLPIIPALTRKTLLFGVRVPEESASHLEAAEMKRQYITVSIAGIAILLVLEILQYILAPQYTLIAILYFPLLIVPIQLIAFIPCWKRALRLKEENRWRTPAVSFAETSTSHSRGRLSAIPWGWYISSLAVIVICAGFLIFRFEAMPEIVPTHWNANWEPDAWGEKSFFLTFIFPLINIITLACMVPGNIALEKAKLQIDLANPAKSFAQHRQYRRRMGHSLGFMTLSIIGAMQIMDPNLGIKPNIWVFTVFITTVPMIPLLVTFVRCGQGGCKLNPEISEADALAAGYRPPDMISGMPERNDDKFWALGMFYHNPNDPAVLVEDRFGNNIGFNYSRTCVKISVTALILLLIGVYIWLTPLMLRLM